MTGSVVYPIVQTMGSSIIRKVPRSHDIAKAVELELGLTKGNPESNNAPLSRNKLRVAESSSMSVVMLMLLA